MPRRAQNRARCARPGDLDVWWQRRGRRVPVANGPAPRALLDFANRAGETSESDAADRWYELIMALFARRAIQRSLDANSKLVSTEKLRDWVRRLSTISRDYVATEWEVVLVSVFAKFGCVQHEPPLGPRPIDLVFEAPGLKFGADIAAISDQSLHERNPIARFRNEFNRRVEKAGIRTGRFVFRVEEKQPVGQGRKRKLLLPPVNQFDAIIFNAAFDEYIRAIQDQPLVPRPYRVGHQSPDVYISIEYQPGKGWGVGSLSYGSYTSTSVKDDNPLFNALKSKADQLRRSGYDGIRGIVVCDGGSRIFTEISTWATYSIDQVVQEFFRQNTSVSFVATIGIRPQRSGISAAVHLDAEPRLFVRPADQRHQWSADLGRLLQQVASALPEAAADARKCPDQYGLEPLHPANQALLRRLCHDEERNTHVRTRVARSSRWKARLQLFAKRYDLGGGNVFRLFRDRGRMISSVAIEHCPDEDDDWVVLRFSDGDPATSEFTVPGIQPPSA